MFYIPALQSLAQNIKGFDLIEILKSTVDKDAKQGGKEWAKGFPKNDFATFTSEKKKSHSGPFYSHIVTITYIEDSDKAFEYKITECLFAKTFREAGASDIGYAYICYGDYGTAEGFNPKIRLIRPKTLMQGHDCCHFRWVWEG